MTEPETVPRPPSWLGVNAYGVLIGFLAILNAVTYFIAPTGRIFLAVAHVGLGMSGVGLIVSYATRRVDIEVYASVLLALSHLLDVARTIYLTEPRQFDFRLAVIQLAIVVTVTMRVSALMRGGTIVLPEWRRR